MSELLEHHHHHHQSHENQPPPQPWAKFRLRFRQRWALPFLYIDWLSQWAAYGLRQLSILELLETCSSFTLLIGLIFYFTEAPERTKSKHYQAWQVINTAQGKGGSGGRTDALRDLNEDRVPLVGVDLADSFLQRVELENGDLRRGNFHGADLKEANLRGANLEQSAFGSANLRGAKLTESTLIDADFVDADLNNASLAKTHLNGANFEKADLRGADLEAAEEWKSAASFRLANIHGIHNAPDGFVQWAISKGAVDSASDADWALAISREAAGK